MGGTNATSGGAYQRIPATAGLPYSVSVWTYAGDTLTSCSLGVNPAGGTNASIGVTWTSANTNATWLPKTWTGIATSNHLTVYFKVTSPDNVKRNGYFDDTSPAPGPPQLVAQRNGNALTLTWPDCPSALLQRANSLTPPVNWSPTTNQVTAVGGQRSVTLIPQSGTGFFRLVLE